MPAARSRGRAERGSDKPKPRSDAYVGLLAISLVALTAAMLFAFLNWNTYPEGKPKPVQVAPRAQGPAPGAPAAPGAPVPPGPNPAQPPQGAPPVQQQPPQQQPMPMPRPPQPKQ
jgi:hypothetical protein